MLFGGGEGEVLLGEEIVLGWEFEMLFGEWVEGRGCLSDLKFC